MTTINYKVAVTVEGGVTSEALFKVSQLLPHDLSVKVYEEDGKVYFAGEQKIDINPEEDFTF